MTENLRGKIYKGFFWDLLGKLADQGIGFAISVILARLLTPAEFGLVAMAAVVISLAGVLIDSGLGVALIQRKEVTDYHYGSVFYFNMVTGSLLTVIFFFSAGLVADFYNQPVLKPVMQVLSFNFIIDSFTRVQAAWLTKQMKFNVLTKAKIASLVVGGGTGVVLAFLGYGVWALVFQSLISGVVRNIYINTFSGFRFKAKYRFEALKELWSFGGRMFLSSIIATIISKTDTVIIGKLFKASTLGFYQRARSLEDFIIRYTSGSLMPVLFPALSSIKDEEERYVKIVDKGFHILSFVSLALVGLLFILAKDLIVLIFSEKWLPSVEYFKILLIGGFVFPLSTLLVNILSSKGNSKAFLYSGFIKQSMYVLNLIFGFMGGVKMYLYGYVLVGYVALFVNFWYAGREIKQGMVFFAKRFFPYYIVTFFVVVFLSFVNKVYLIKSELIHLMLYLPAYLILFFILSKIFKLKGLDFVIDEIKNIKNAKAIEN